MLRQEASSVIPMERLIQNIGKTHGNRDSVTVKPFVTLLA